MTRDMTIAQFNAALKRNGFIASWYGFKDTTGQCPNVEFGGIYSMRPFKLRRRATISKLIAERKKYAAQRQTECGGSVAG